MKLSRHYSRGNDGEEMGRKWAVGWSFSLKARESFLQLCGFFSLADGISNLTLFAPHTLP